MPILRDKRFFVTFDKDYKRQDREKEMGDNFILFYPLIIEIFCNKKINVKTREM